MNPWLPFEPRHPAFLRDTNIVRIFTGHEQHCRLPGSLPVGYLVTQVGNWGTGSDDVGLIQSTKAPKHQKHKQGSNLETPKTHRLLYRGDSKIQRHAAPYDPTVGSCPRAYVHTWSGACPELQVTPVRLLNSNSMMSGVHPGTWVIIFETHCRVFQGRIAQTTTQN